MGKTWTDLVKDYFPNATDDECNYILWEKTAFPLCGLETVEKQLQEYKKLTTGIKEELKDEPMLEMSSESHSYISDIQAEQTKNKR